MSANVTSDDEKPKSSFQKCWMPVANFLFTDKVVVMDLTNTIRCNGVISIFFNINLTSFITFGFWCFTSSNKPSDFTISAKI